MIVRCFMESDRQQFKALCKDFYSSHATLRDYNETITDNTFSHALSKRHNILGYLLVTKDTDIPIGYALVTSYWCNEEGGKIVVLDELFISPNERHKGYASQFMEWLESEFKNKAVSITLEVLTTNVKACQLYSKEGFSPDGFVTYSKRLENR